MSIGDLLASPVFWALLLSGLVAPVTIYLTLLIRRRISRLAVGLCALVLIVLAGCDVVLLQALHTLATATASLVDDVVFASEYRLALYVLPLISGGLGVGLLSHVLIAHLRIAELEHERHDRDRR